MLTSARNPKVAAAARLRKRAFREVDRRFLLEGAQAVKEALAAAALEALFTTDPLDPLAVAAAQAGVEVHHVAGSVVRHLTSTVTPQPLVGVASFLDVDLDVALARAFASGSGAATLLHEVRDPGNAGTVLRSADAAGPGALVCSATSVDLYNPKTVRASAGSIFHLPVARGVGSVDAIEAARDAGARVLAMASRGEADLYRTDLTGNVLFVFGNEAHGLPDELAGRADAVVRVPIGGRAESLNLAAAATVCLFERQRRELRGAEALESIVASAAHDIRSPLTAMKGFGYALERRWSEMTEDQRALMLQGIVHDADRMDTVLRHLVDAARVVGGTFEPLKEQVEVSELVGSIAEAQRRDPDHPAIVWEGGLATAFADPARVKTALLAFCESLVWWGSEGPIHVDGDVRDAVLRLRASRVAAPMDPAALESLFVPRRPGEGAGSKIGLFATRGVAEAQGGRCWGTYGGDLLTFHLELPAGPDHGFGS